jgi:hypothetical protein
MNYGFIDDMSIAQVLHHDALQQLRSHTSVPHALRIHDDNRPAAAHAEAWCLAALDAMGSEEQSFTLEEHGQERIERTTRALG